MTARSQRTGESGERRPRGQPPRSGCPRHCDHYRHVRRRAQHGGKALEDLGWFVVDNLPPGLLPTMVDLAARSNGAVPRIAAVVDVRSRAFSTDLKSAVSDLGARGASARVVYLEAAEDTLVRRFDSERRPHPLQGNGRVTDGI